MGATAGLDGWSYDDVLPYFRRMENQERGADRWHGKDGPLAVEDARLTRPVCDDFIAAAISEGVPGQHNGRHDYNGAQQEGVGYFQVGPAAGRMMDG